jgi:hypothetical protein
MTGLARVCTSPMPAAGKQLGLLRGDLCQSADGDNAAESAHRLRSQATCHNVTCALEQFQLGLHESLCLQYSTVLYCVPYCRAVHSSALPGLVALA